MPAGIQALNAAQNTSRGRMKVVLGHVLVIPPVALAVSGADLAQFHCQKALFHIFFKPFSLHQAMSKDFP